MFNDDLFRLYTKIFDVALPIVVKTVSKVKVSVENWSLSFGFVENLSSLHEVTAKEIMTSNENKSEESDILEFNVIANINVLQI